MTGGEPARSIRAKDIEDPLETMLKKTGCMESHYQVQVIGSRIMVTTPMSLVGRWLAARVSHQRETCKMVILVRTDLPMGKGKTAAQCAHAALQCYLSAQNNRNDSVICQDWLNAGQPKIVLRVQDEEELLRVAHDARRAGLNVAVIKDAGKTQVESGTISVLGIGPGPKGRVDQLTSKLKLL